MQRTRRSLLASLAVVACLWPVAVAVHAQEAPGAGLSVEEVRGAFSSAGYAVDPPHSWTWTSPAVTSFQVHDAQRDRIVLVLVYPSTAAAELARRQATTRDEQLVIGYGPGTWNGNVALVQASSQQLEQAYQAQADRDNGVYVETDPPSAATAVDVDFLEALNNGAANL